MMDLNILCFAFIGIVASFIIVSWMVCCAIEGAGFVLGGLVEWIKEKIEKKNAKKDWDEWFANHPEIKRNF